MSDGMATRLVLAACAAACLSCMLAAQGRDRRLWLFVAAVAALFAFHKGVDGQTQVIAAIKHVARGGGWYGERRTPQWMLTVVVALLAAVVVVGRTHTRPGPVRTAAALAIALIAYAVIGMISLHAWDRLVSRLVGGIRAYTVIELAIPLAISLCALAALRGGRRGRAS